MNTKQIIALAAILVVAVAAIAGTAYAYQATLTNEANTVDSNYLELDSATQMGHTFDNSDLQWDALSTEPSKATYTPAGELVDIARGLKGKQVGNSFTMTINSVNIETGNWWTVFVEPKTAAGAAADLKGAYAMKFVYTAADEVTYTDYVILDAADSGDNPSKQPLFLSNSTSAASVQNVVLSLYAIPIDATLTSGTLGTTALDITGVDFRFTAEAADTVPGDVDLTINIKDKDGTALAVGAATDVTAYTAAGARVCGAVEDTASAKQVFKISVPKGYAYTADAQKTKYDFHSTPTAVLSAAGSVDVTESVMSVALAEGAVAALTTGTYNVTTWETACAALKFTATYGNETVVQNITVDEDGDGKMHSNAETAITWNTAGWYKVTFTLTIDGVTVSTPLWVQITAA